MKPKCNPIKNSHKILTLGIAVAALGGAQHGRAATITWDGSDSAVWTLGANWVGGIAPANDITTDIAHFNLSTYGGNPVFAPRPPDAQQITGITIGSSNGAMTIPTSTGTNRLQIGASGITIANGAGAFGLGINNNTGVRLAASQTWTNNSTSLATIASIGATTTSTLTFAGSGTGGFRVPFLITNAASMVVDLPDGTVEFAATGVNSYSGTTTLTQGKLSISADNHLSSTASALIFNGGTLRITGTALTSLNAGRTTTFNAGKTVGFDIDSAVNTFTVSQDLNQTTGGLTKTGAGALALTNANTYEGTTAVNAGTLALGNVNAIQNSTLDTGTSGTQAVTFTVAGTNTYNLGGLQGADDLAIGGNTISVGANNTSTSFSGAIGGTDGALTKVGSGTLTLSTTNTYTGATTVSAGTLVVEGSISTSTTTVQTGATLGGSGTVGGLTVNSGAFHTPGSSPGIQNTGNYSNAGTLAIEINGATVGTGYDQVNTTGTVSLSGLLDITMGYTPANNALFFILANDGVDAISGTFTGLTDGSTYTLGGQEFVISYFGDSVGQTFTGGNDVVLKAVTVIPEPRAALLGSLGMLMLLRRRR
jgi:autotransporter-associated beta strand protein